ncbi:glycosyltransferase 87 family protein [Rathayibacter oskolensis]|uniref:glycosyltransferase 87 family protein n=1 Tax=Rathayibacter oskolensis TaxID=1891671 RepID=UPI00265F07B6|nr:glycosyltransferase 87 family protein [Rathayibacter oskolensis]WKK71785.1 glycosyltransferase 87 family protein [Rathayibacter oskolensis]
MSTPGTRAPRRPVAWLRENRDSATVLWTGFALVHVLLSLLALFAPGLPMGDVSIVYKQWMQTAVDGGGIAGIDTGWVYPILAWAPIASSWLFGAAGYDLVWLVLVALVDAAAFALLLRGGVPVRLAAARWWLLFLVLLGPIAVGRIDAFTVPPAIAGMLWAGTRPAASALLLTIATWIKVWPAAILAAAVLVLRGRVRTVLVPVATSVVIVLAVVLVGGGDQVFSFVGDQTTRGLQIEAVVSTPWMWAASLGSAGGSYVWYAAEINTFEMHGQEPRSPQR